MLLLGAACSGDDEGPGERDASCVPQCDGRECGDDTCGGECGGCDPDVACNPVVGLCAVLCGNETIDADESCDPPGTCLSACEDDGDACTQEELIGTAASCSSACTSEPVTDCIDGDGCCAPGCGASADSDCDPVCGNGVLEAGETCGEEGIDCPETCAPDGDQCTDDAPVGSAETCDAACAYPVIDPCSLDQARGVTVGNISVDQGIRIPVRASEGLVALEERNGALIVARPMLVRAAWDIESSVDFTTREIRAVLTLAYEDGTSQSLEDIKRTSASSGDDYEDFDEAYTFTLSSEQVRAGMKLSVELFEVDESYRELPAPAVPARFPEEPGSTFELGVNTEPSHLEVVLVPFHHDLGGDCDPAPDLHVTITRGGKEMPEWEYYRQRLRALNPVSEVTVTPHEVVEFTGSATSSGDLQTALRQLREENGAEDYEFYYGLIRPCDAGPPFSGVASAISNGDDGLPDRSDARYRVGWGTYSGPGSNALVSVHEVGHLQGRRHVGCNGDLIDPDYPNTTGDTEVYGWDIFSSDTIREPNGNDYMSYCGSWWISEYGWQIMEPWAAELSRWRAEQLFTRAQPSSLLYATIQPGKAPQFWTGSVDELPEIEPSSDTVTYYSGQTLLTTVPAERREISEHGDGYYLTARPPEAWQSVTHLVYSDGSSQQVVERAAVRFLSDVQN